jgi:Tfp pilus assembly protein PilF
MAVCALLSKGSTVILPLALCLFVWWKQRRAGADVLAVIPFFVVSGVAALVTIHFQSRIMDPTVAQWPLAARMARAGEAIWFYLGKDVWPVDLCAIYPKWGMGHGFVPLILAGALAVVLWMGRRWWGRGLFFAWAYFITALLPVLGILKMSFLDQAYVADWWQQLALPGVMAIAGAGIAMAWVRLPRSGRGGLAVVIMVIVFILGERTWSEASGYESMEIHCRRTLVGNPDAWTAHNNLGNVFNSQGRLDEAAREYRSALRLKPSDAGAHANLGIVFARLHRLDEAIAEYHCALNLAPENAKYWFNLGSALRAQRHNIEAIDAFSHAIDDNVTDKNWTAPRYEMGTIFLELGRPAEAVRQAENILDQNPGALSGHYLMARAAAADGMFDVAAAAAAAALKIARGAGDEKTIRQMQDALDACKAGRAPVAPEL